jgi:alpha-galactosidase
MHQLYFFNYNNRNNNNVLSIFNVIIFTTMFLLISMPPSTNALDNGVGRTPPLGWNTWKTCGEKTCGHDICNEAEIKSVAIAMKNNGMYELGYNYVNLDDCWAYPRDPKTQQLTWDPSRFPDGLPNLIKWLHGEGFKFGLYTSAGNVTCSSGGRTMPIPGSKGHYELDAKTFAEWEVDYVKLDWCGDIKKDLKAGKQAHLDFAKAMNESKREMFLEVVAGYFFLWGDVPSVANSWRFCTDHHDEWKSSSVQLTCRIDQKKSVSGKPGAWPYMDFLLTGGEGCSKNGVIHPHCPGQTDDEYRTTFALWSISQSPMIVATDVRNFTGVMSETILNKDIIKLHQSTETPPGGHIKYWECSELLSCEVWGRKINANGTSWMVALVNRGKKSHKITVKWSDLGLSNDENGNIYDVWGQATIGSAKGSYTSEVASHGTTLIRVDV